MRSDAAPPANTSSGAASRRSIRLRIGGAWPGTSAAASRGGDALLDSPVGLDGQHVFGCLWAAGAALETLDLDELRAELGATGDSRPLTRLAPRLLVARTLATSTGAARAALATVWARCGHDSAACLRKPPRLWAT